MDHDLVVSEVDRAYLAGIIDGEGTISIQFMENGCGCKHYQGRLEISNTDIRLVEWLVINFGGRAIISNKKKTAENPNWKVLYRVNYYGGNAERVIRQAMPYLRLKVRQAELVLELRERMAKNKGRGILTEAEWKYREILHAECRRLNHRGRVDAERLSERTPAGEMRQSELAGNEPREEAPKSLPAGE